MDSIYYLVKIKLSFLNIFQLLLQYQLVQFLSLMSKEIQLLLNGKHLRMMVVLQSSVIWLKNKKHPVTSGLKLIEPVLQLQNSVARTSLRKLNIISVSLLKMRLDRVLHWKLKEQPLLKVLMVYKIYF